MISDYCPGGDLSQYLEIEECFSEDKARLYIQEILLGIEALHKQNIIFRDLKPDNVIIDKKGHAMLTDFGLSRENVRRPTTGAILVAGLNVGSTWCGCVAMRTPTGASCQLSRGAHGATFNLVPLGPPDSSRLEPMAPLATWCHGGLLTALTWSPWRHLQPGATGAS